MAIGKSVEVFLPDQEREFYAMVLTQEIEAGVVPSDARTLVRKLQSSGDRVILTGVELRMLLTIFPASVEYDPYFMRQGEEAYQPKASRHSSPYPRLGPIKSNEEEVG